MALNTSSPRRPRSGFRPAQAHRRQRLWENAITRLERAMRELIEDRHPESLRRAARLRMVVHTLRSAGPPIMPPDPSERSGPPSANRPRRLTARRDIAARQYRKGAYVLRQALRFEDPAHRILRWALTEVTSLPDGDPFRTPPEKAARRLQRKPADH